MEKMYQILLTMQVEKGADKKTVKESIYSYLKELIDDDSLYIEEREVCKEI